jgi:VIT1/CCC1 family predicted Fe2+/Mn2+ transporter
MNISKHQADINEPEMESTESQLLRLNKTVSIIQQQLDEERRLLQSSRLSTGIIVISTVILLGLAILYFSSALNTLSSVLFHGCCLAGIGIVVALLCTVLPKNKKNR